MNCPAIPLLGRPCDLKDMPCDSFASGGFRAIGYVLLLPGTPSINPREPNPFAETVNHIHRFGRAWFWW